MICENLSCLLPSAFCLSSPAAFTTQIGLLYSLVSHTHSGILPIIGALIVGLFFDNDLLRLIGCGIFLYVLAFGAGLVIPYCNQQSRDLIRELISLKDQLKRLEAVNQSLDEHRDKMLFDEDPHYWNILEDLAV